MNQQIEKKKLPNIKNIIIVASGKGGVGKSTVAAGVAMSLAGEGYKTGLLDADIFGPSVPLLFDLQDAKPEVEVRDGKQCLMPFEKYGIKLMSIGFFIDTKQAVVWRGPRVSSGISQLLSDTYWGELDYLVIDTPPGTGDVHITLLQNFETSGAVVVTTPQQMALADVKKAVDMFNDPQIGTPIFGIVENMAWFSPTAHPEEKYFLFGKGGGQSLANEFNLPLVAQIPFNEKMGESCDAGKMAELLTDKSIKAAFNQLFNGIISK
ncbi:Mrp/NBP35 family ATP-binding protein [Acetobacteroides hydrogenigenes]|uniref:Iron-sulfur cluster carrier protein n=1 Tax=Acetobacteroides hydrogenigenes TaxID=979970 RepID=A0A4R2ELY2_9BACT|nr:Mrp/NBP35 family ATP-binding protein [Acetobacteroides hydrogenigenes]TCN65339.1 ATP-binding protein involved in chromosome partitioning [Acetobacteroides hydrogenigenes]